MITFSFSSSEPFFSLLNAVFVSRTPASWHLVSMDAMVAEHEKKNYDTLPYDMQI